MSDLLIPDVDDALRARLEARAQAHRHSLESEVRQTLCDAVGLDAELPGPDESVASVFLRIFGPERVWNWTSRPAAPTATGHRQTSATLTTPGDPVRHTP